MAQFGRSFVTHPSHTRSGGREAPAGGTAFTQTNTGSITSSSAIVDAAAKRVIGSTTSSSALGKASTVARSGSTSASSAVRQAVTIARTGSITATGALATLRLILQALAGTITGTSTLREAVTIARTGTSTPTGTPRQAVAITRSGSTTGAGVLGKVAAIVRGGAVWAENMLVLPGVSNAQASTPTSAALDVTGDLELIVRAYAPFAWQTRGNLIAKSFTSYRLYIGSDRRPGLQVNVGGTARFRFATADLPLGTVWVRATRIAATGVVTIDHAPDLTGNEPPTSWTALPLSGTVIAGAVDTNSNSLVVGSFGGGEYWGGGILRAIVKHGGTTVFDADFTIQTLAAASFAESANGATVTVSSPAAIGRRPGSALLRSAANRLVGSTTPAGSPRKAVAITRTGSVTPSATLATVRAILQVLTGSITATGQLVRRTAKNVVGTTTASSTVTKATRKAIVGSVTSSATLRKAAAVSFVGAIVAASGIRRAVSIVRSGVSALAGALVTVFTGGSFGEPGTVVVTASAPTATLAVVGYHATVTVDAPTCDLTALPCLTELTAAFAACTLETV